jgi:hypothetical protein
MRKKNLGEAYHTKKWNWESEIECLVLFIETGEEDKKNYAKKKLIELGIKLDRWNQSNDIPNGYLKAPDQIDAFC